MPSLLIKYVRRGGVADAAGLEAGDRIIAINDRAARQGTLNGEMRRASPRLIFSVLRDFEVKTILLTPSTRAPAVAEIVVDNGALDEAKAVFKVLVAALP